MRKWERMFTVSLGISQKKPGFTQKVMWSIYFLKATQFAICFSALLFSCTTTDNAVKSPWKTRENLQELLKTFTGIFTESVNFLPVKTPWPRTRSSRGNFQIHGPINCPWILKIHGLSPKPVNFLPVKTPWPCTRISRGNFQIHGTINYPWI